MPNNGKCRKVLQFNLMDFRHKQVLDIFSKQPRHVTDLVVNAVLHYVVCPDAHLEFNRENVKELVIDVLREMQKDGTLTLNQGSAQNPPVDEDNLYEDLGDVMGMFRGRG